MFVAPYDDPYTIAGQGTIGTEILRQVQALYCCSARRVGQVYLRGRSRWSCCFAS